MKLSGMSEGARNMAQRMVNAEERFLAFAQETAGLNREEALTALVMYRKCKAVRFDYVGGQFQLTSGGFADPKCLQVAAGRMV